MRNLKKVLSLTLALVMLIGMMVVGAGAATYTDTVDSDKQEAIEVTSAVEIIMGDGNGTFRPDGTLRRSEAAVIIARVLLTNSVVTKLGSTDCQFTDVTDDWAKAPIQYCANVGIINGRSATSFDPNANVTGVEFAKMLMCVLDETKDYTQSNNWKLDVRRDALSAKLDTNNVPLTDAALSREDAAQMAFNAIQYSPSGAKSYKVDGMTFDNFIEAYVASNNGNKKIEVTTARDSLAVTRFNLAEGVADDGYGRTVRTWSVNNDVVFTATVSTSTPVVTYTAETKATQIAKDLKGYTVDIDGDDVSITTASLATAARMDYTLNGDTTAQDASSTKSAAQRLAELTANGVIVEVYAGADKKCNILVIKKSVATVSADPSTRTSQNEDQVRVPGVIAGWVAADTVIGWEDLAKGDVVLYVKSAADGITRIEKAESFEGVVNGSNDVRGLRVDGTYYNRSALSGAAANYGWTTNDYRNTYTFYLDDGGFIVAGSTESPTTASTQYAVVLNNGWYTGSGLADGAHGEAQLLFTDGSVEIVTVSKVNNNDATKADGTPTIKYLDNNTIVTYSVVDDKYELTNVTSFVSDTAGNTSTATGSASMSVNAVKKTVNNATIFLVSNGNNSYSVYTGKDDVPTIADAKVHAVTNAAGIVRVAYLYGGTASDVSASDYAYIPELNYTAIPNEDGNGVAYYEVEAIVNGEETTLNVKKDHTELIVATGSSTSPTDTLHAGRLYQVVSKESSTDAVTLFKTVTMQTGVALGDGTVTTTSNSKAYAVNEDTVIYRIADDNTVSLIDWDDSFSDATDQVYVADNNGVATHVCIVEDILDDPYLTVGAVIDTTEASEKVGPSDWDSTGTKDGTTKENAKEGSLSIGTTTGVTAGVDFKLTFDIDDGAEVELMQGTEPTKTASTGQKLEDIVLFYTVTAESGRVCWYKLTLEVTSA